jgi:SAM-dependent methyltransferase
VAEQHFASVAPRYDALRDTDHDAVLLIRDRLPNEPLVGVDVGAGTGRYRELLRRVLPERSWVLAADRSHAMLTSRRCEPGMALRCEAERLPSADGSVGFVTTFNAVHHFDLGRFTDEVARVLRPGGDLFVYTRTPEQHAKSMWGRAFPGFVSHESRLHDETTLVRSFCGLGAVETTSFSFARYATAARLAERTVATTKPLLPTPANASCASSTSTIRHPSPADPAAQGRGPDSYLNGAGDCIPLPGPEPSARPR